MKKVVSLKKSVRADNRKATFDVALEEKFEAGLILTGNEIKSIRANRMNMQGAYVKPLAGGLVLIGLHLSLAEEPERTRALLLHKKEMEFIKGKLSTKGWAAVPLALYLKRGWAKVEIGVGPGRKNYDKRRLLKDRDLVREEQTELKRFPRT